MDNKGEQSGNGQYPDTQSVGEAYAFFSYGGPNNDLSPEVIGDIRDRLKLPSALELRVFGDADKKLSQSPDLAALTCRDVALRQRVKESDETCFNYVIQGNHPGVTNEDVAYELGRMMNGINHTFYAPNEPFSYNIAYKRPGEDDYVFVD